MRAMVFHGVRGKLDYEDIALPEPCDRELQIRIEACGVCRTDLHIVDGDLTNPVLPLVPGHETVGRVAGIGVNVSEFEIGQRVGVPWLGSTCNKCEYCQMGQENLCDAPTFTGYSRNGGFAQACNADAGYVFALPEISDPVSLAPLLCAGLIGYRCLRLAGDANDIGFYGFGAAAHILCQIAVWQGRNVYAFTRPGDVDAQAHARKLGAVWAGEAHQLPPIPLDAAIIFAPVGALVPAALKAVRKGGSVVCGGIHMSDIPSFPYADLWEERQIRSVANLTRKDGEEFFPLAQEAGVVTQTTTYALRDANTALNDMRQGRLQGAVVLVP